MKTIDLVALVTVTGGNLASSSPSRPGLSNPKPWTLPGGPKLPSPGPTKPTMPLGPFVPDDSRRLIA